MEPSSLSAKSCLLVGAGGGIGRACAKALAIEGASIVLAGRDEGRLSEVQTMLLAGGVEEARLTTAVGDIVAAATAPRFANAARDRFGKLDLVVNAAGSATFEAFLDADPDRLASQLMVNAGGAMRLAHAALEPLMTTHGHFIQIISGLAHTAKARTAAYTASQHALVGLLQALRLEVGQKVRFSTLTVAGAGVDTRFWDTAERRVDRGAMMKPERVAEAVIALLRAHPSAFIDDVRLRTP